MPKREQQADEGKSTFTQGAPKKEVIERLMDSGKFAFCKNNSEDIAALIHIFLTVSVWIYKTFQISIIKI